MKRKLIFPTVLLAGLLLMLAVPAMAAPYALKFDGDAAGATLIQETIWGWDLEGFPKPTTVGVVDIATVQSLGANNILGNGDTFTESFTVNVSNGLSSPATGYSALRGGVIGTSGYYNTVPAVPLFVDLSLSGNISDYSDGGTQTTAANASTSLLDDSYISHFTAGQAVLYADVNGNQTYDAGTDTRIADFNLVSAGPVIIVPTVFSGTGAVVDLGFAFTYMNMAYFAQEPGFPPISGLVLTLAQGGVAGVNGAIAGDQSVEPDTITIGFQETGFDAKFQSVPEPASLLLLGSGLIGVVGVLRRRTRKN